MPSIPESHGNEYSRSGSNGGCCCAAIRFETFGIRSLSSFCAHPCVMYWPSGRSLSVETMMSRPMPSPEESGPWTFAKYCPLSLMSSK
jgi:hypothetical protein